MSASQSEHRAAADAAAEQELPKPAAATEADDVVSTTRAARQLKDDLGRVWSEARDTVREVGDTWRRGAGNVGAEARHAASQTRDTLGEALSGVGELGEDIAQDSLQLARSVGMNLEGYVRKYPLRSVAIAVATGAVLAHLLRGRR